MEKKKLCQKNVTKMLRKEIKYPVALFRDTCGCYGTDTSRNLPYHRRDLWFRRQDGPSATRRFHCR